MGRVRDSNGKPVKGASVETLLGIGSPQPEVRTSGEDGSFEFESIAPGHHFVRVTADGFMARSQDIDVPRGQVGRVVLVLEKGQCAVSGRVTEGERRPLGAEVTLLRGGIVIQKVSTSVRDGTYSFQHLTGGLYELQVTSVCHEARGWSGNVNESTRVDLMLPIIEGCSTAGICEVCEETKEVRYCRFCHAPRAS